MTTSNQVTLQHIEDFFTLGKQPEVVYDAATVTKGLGVLNPLEEVKVPEPKVKEGSDYASKYQEEQERELFDHVHKCATEISAPTIRTSSLCDVDDTTTVAGDLPSMQELLPTTDPATLYRTYYSSSPCSSADLPITKYKEQISRMIAIHQVLVIQGSTGCGKTTQVPQYILDRNIGLGVRCNIVVTQPRRLAAISIARRVCEERGWQLGTIVGYQVGMESKTSADTCLTYMTTGVLLQKLISEKHMNMYTHVVIDEVHERDIDTDLVLLLVKKFLRTNSKGAKVVLMSATFDVEDFCKYFARPIRAKMMNAKTFDIPEKPYSVTDYYLESLASLGQLPELDPDVPSLPPESYSIAHKLLIHFDKMEREEQEETVNGFAKQRGAVLVFLPGYDEISKMQDILSADASRFRWWIIPLHSTITTEEQVRVFCRPHAGYRKVILSTNIAESSITVPDIIFVIDFCLSKCLVCDPETNYSCLQLCWASKANCKQRRGRAGRVSPGRVYHMVPSYFFERCLPEYGDPEIKRCPLEQAVLRVKKLDQGEPKALLSLALDPPDLTDIETAVLVLKEVGALAITARGKITPYDGDLMLVGKVMSILPLDVRVSKMIVYGFMLDCLEECIIIAACISLQSIFSKPFQQMLQSYKSRLSWAEGTFSDCLAYLNAFRMWHNWKQQGYFGSIGGMSEAEWCRRNFIQKSKIREVEVLVKELIKRLEHVNIRLPQQRYRRDPATDVLMLKIAICAAFYPHYFVKLPLDEKEVSREINNKNPLTTVIVSGLPQNQGLLYVNALRQMLKPCGLEMQIDFEEQRAYIDFKPTNDDSGTTILNSVYLAVKMRLLRMPLVLRLYDPDEAERKLSQLIKLRDEHCKKEGLLRSNRITVTTMPSVVKQIPLPTIGKNIIQLRVTCIVSCGHFWAQYDDPEIQMQLNFIEEAIRMHEKRPVEVLPLGHIVLAPFSANSEDEECEYYRAKVIEVSRNGQEAKVFFIDYGNQATIRRNKLCDIDSGRTPELISTPAQAFECFLSEIKPAALKSSKQSWSESAVRKFQLYVAQSKQLYARVYSVVQSHVRLELIAKAPDGRDFNINEELIREELADKAEESYASKQNHEARVQYELKSMRTLVPDVDNMTSFVELPISEGMAAEECHLSSHKIRLRGPASPLEVKFNGITRLSYGRAIQFDRDGVNSVPLDPEPQEQHNRLLVACHVGSSASGTAIAVRNTTLMPNIRGFPALMSLLFCPYAELRTDPDRVKYTGALCGLGYDPYTRQSLYKDHDIELTFDAVIEQDDVANINLVRMHITALLGNEEDFQGSGPTLRDWQIHMRECLIKLLRKVRKCQEPQECKKPYMWNLIPPEHLIEMSEMFTERVSTVLPAHKAVQLSENTFLESLRAHIRELHALASRSEHEERNHCRLCNVTCHTPRELLLHITSAPHKQHENEIYCD